MLKEGIDGKEILDIGTGSGCIAISLAKNLPNAKVSAIDISEDALEVARENAKLNNVDIDFINADIFDYKSEKKYDVIVSNPPYVTESEKLLMKRNVLKYEPNSALFVDNDNPLIYYQKILEFAKNQLNNDGKIYFELNENLKLHLIDLLKNYSIKVIDFISDLYKKNRFLKLNF